MPPQVPKILKAGECKNGHKISSFKDLKLCSSEGYYYCLECKHEQQRRYKRNMREKNGAPKKDRNFCNNALHDLRVPGSWKINNRGHRICLVCAAVARRRTRTKPGLTEVSLSCKDKFGKPHEICFSIAPSLHDQVYCQRCRDYSRVTFVGVSVPEEAESEV